MMIFFESNLKRIENFQQIHLKFYCLVISKAELIGFTNTFHNLFLEVMF